jgi:Holliday junction resolvase RusA-like endonuclease
MMLVVEIPGRPPTPNARPGNWPQAYRERIHWRDVAATYAGEARRRYEINGPLPSLYSTLGVKLAAPAQMPLDAAFVEVMFVVPTRSRRDLDNLIAGSKPLTDGLVAAGVLKDDSTDVIRRMAFGVQYEHGKTATIYTIRSFQP